LHFWPRALHRFYITAACDALMRLLYERAAQHASYTDTELTNLIDDALTFTWIAEAEEARQETPDAKRWEPLEILLTQMADEMLNAADWQMEQAKKQDSDDEGRPADEQAELTEPERIAKERAALRQPQPMRNQP
jgi:hypothetical protein